MKVFTTNRRKLRYDNVYIIANKKVRTVFAGVHHIIKRYYGHVDESLHAGGLSHPICIAMLAKLTGQPLEGTWTTQQIREYTKIDWDKPTVAPDELWAYNSIRAFVTIAIVFNLDIEFQ